MGRDTISCKEEKEREREEEKGEREEEKGEREKVLERVPKRSPLFLRAATWAQCYKTFYDCNLRMFEIS